MRRTGLRSALDSGTMSLVRSSSAAATPASLLCGRGLPSSTSSRERARCRAWAAASASPSAVCAGERGEAGECEDEYDEEAWGEEACAERGELVGVNADESPRSLLPQLPLSSWSDGLSRQSMLSVGWLPRGEAPCDVALRGVPPLDLEDSGGDSGGDSEDAGGDAGTEST